MTTFDSTKENKTSSENSENLSKWFNEVSKIPMNIYSKQLIAASEFYSNYFNSFFEIAKNSWNPFKQNNNLYSGNGDGTKFGFMSFPNFNGTNGASNQWSDTLEKLLKQMVNYNQNLMTMFSEKVDKDGLDWASISSKFSKNTEDLFQSVKRIQNSFLEASDDQIEFSKETNKKLQEDINKELTYITKQNQKFWSDFLNSPNVNQKEKSQFNDEERKPLKVTEKMGV